ncbi:MAG TPA: gamma-glutamylcyclotransferase [Pseudomonadales bacterium]|nr:gamma-glutamylcyclotransferase [Pseudomonadales bacterium]
MQARLCVVGGAVLSDGDTTPAASRRYEDTGRVWVFGYGSLIWRPDFPFAERRRAHVDGWVRRFWQGSHDHRGTPDAPGRVVTLIPEPRARCVGMAYLIEHDVFDHLDHREKNGYERNDVMLAFDDGCADGVVYIAHRGNYAFLGDAPLDAIARQVLVSRGPSGANLEYLYELARALRDLDADDSHVFELESRVKSLELDGHPTAA